MKNHRLGRGVPFCKSSTVMAWKTDILKINSAGIFVPLSCSCIHVLHESYYIIPLCGDGEGVIFQKIEKIIKKHITKNIYVIEQI